MGACEITPPTRAGDNHTTLKPRTNTIFPASESSVAAGRRPARSSSPLRGCGRSSLTLSRTATRNPAAARKIQKNSQPQPGDSHASHRANFPRPLDTNGPYGCRSSLTILGTFHKSS
jgi:hypothetical protein